QLGDLTGAPSLENNQLKSKKFSAFPGAATALWHFGDSEDYNATHHVLALSMIVQSNTNRELKGDFALRFGPTGSMWYRNSVSDTHETTEYLFGPTYAINWGAFRMGASVFLAYTDVARTSHDSMGYSDPVYYTTINYEEFFEGDVFGLQPVIGIQGDPVYGLSLGVSWMAPMIPLTGTFNYRSSAHGFGPSNSDLNYIEEIRADGDLMMRRPMRLRLGVALGYEKEWSAAVDGEIVFPVEEQYYQKSNFGRSFQSAQQYSAELERYSTEYSVSQPLGYNINAGVEYYLTEMVPFRLGGYYKKSNVDLPADSAHILNLDLDHVGATVGLGVESELGETTFGFQFDYGFGKTISGDAWAELFNIQYVAVDVRNFSGVFFISGTFDLEEFDAIHEIVRKPKLMLGKERKKIALSMISPALAAFAGDPLLRQFENDERFSYPVTHYDEFDDLFERIARMKAALIVSTEIFERMESQVDSFRVTLDPQTDLSMALAVIVRYAQTGDRTAVVDKLIEKPEVARMVELFKMGTAAVESLRFFGQEAAELPNDVQKLIDKAQNDFVGPDLALLPAVARNLGFAEKDALDIVKQIPKLVESITEFFAAWQNVAVSVSNPSDSRMLQFRMTAAEAGSRLAPYETNQIVANVIASDDALYPTVDNDFIDGLQKEVTRVKILVSIGAGALGRINDVRHTLKKNIGSTRRQKLVLRQLRQLATNRGTPDSSLSVLGTDEQVSDAVSAMALMIAVSDELSETTARVKDMTGGLQSIISSPEAAITNGAQIPFILSVVEDLSQRVESTLKDAGDLLNQIEDFQREVR
ncbi:MAG: hypothetical protein JXX14_23290, partial [Deltaproteobacteria bacterium]|nr:hypothetical protein [Deltaproteobacteria bacterium]